MSPNTILSWHVWSRLVLERWLNYVEANVPNDERPAAGCTEKVSKKCPIVIGCRRLRVRHSLQQCPGWLVGSLRYLWAINYHCIDKPFRRFDLWYTALGLHCNDKYKYYSTPSEQSVKEYIEYPLVRKKRRPPWRLENGIRRQGKTINAGFTISWNQGDLAPRPRKVD